MSLVMDESKEASGQTSSMKSDLNSDIPKRECMPLEEKIENMKNIGHNSVGGGPQIKPPPSGSLNACQTMEKSSTRPLQHKSFPQCVEEGEKRDEASDSFDEAPPKLTRQQVGGKKIARVYMAGDNKENAGHDGEESDDSDDSDDTEFQRSRTWDPPLPQVSTKNTFLHYEDPENLEKHRLRKFQSAPEHMAAAQAVGMKYKKGLEAANESHDNSTVNDETQDASQALTLVESLSNCISQCSTVNNGESTVNDEDHEGMHDGANLSADDDAPRVISLEGNENKEGNGSGNVSPQRQTTGEQWSKNGGSQKNVTHSREVSYISNPSAHDPSRSLEAPSVEGMKAPFEEYKTTTTTTTTMNGNKMYPKNIDGSQERGDNTECAGVGRVVIGHEKIGTQCTEECSTQSQQQERRPKYLAPHKKESGPAPAHKNNSGNHKSGPNHRPLHARQNSNTSDAKKASPLREENGWNHSSNMGFSSTSPKGTATSGGRWRAPTTTEDLIAGDFMASSGYCMPHSMFLRHDQGLYGHGAGQDPHSCNHQDPCGSFPMGAGPSQTGSSPYSPYMSPFSGHLADHHPSSYFNYVHASPSRGNSNNAPPPSTNSYALPQYVKPSMNLHTQPTQAPFNIHTNSSNGSKNNNNNSNGATNGNDANGSNNNAAHGSHHTGNNYTSTSTTGDRSASRAGAHNPHRQSHNIGVGGTYTNNTKMRNPQQQPNGQQRNGLASTTSSSASKLNFSGNKPFVSTPPPPLSHPPFPPSSPAHPRSHPSPPSSSAFPGKGGGGSLSRNVIYDQNNYQVANNNSIKSANVSNNTTSSRHSRGGSAFNSQKTALNGGGTMRPWDRPMGNKYLCTFVVGISECESFNVSRRIIGRGGENMRFISKLCEESCKNDKSVPPGTVVTTKIRLRGKGSGFMERETKQEAEVPLQVNVSTSSRDAYATAKFEMQNLLSSIYQEYERLTRQKYSVKLFEHPENPPTS